jgi:hypothetical protein
LKKDISSKKVVVNEDENVIPANKTEKMLNKWKKEFVGEGKVK